MIAATVIGLHLCTAHFGAGPGAALQDRNPGIYVRMPSGATAGAYRNSHSNTSAYAGWTWSTPDGRWALTAGGVTGYDHASVGLLLVPSVSLPAASGVSARLAYLAKSRRDGSHGIHLSVELAL